MRVVNMSRGGDRGAAREGQTSDAPAPVSRIRSIGLAIAPSEIVRFKAIIESYDNLATLRTDDPQRHYLRLYFSPENESEVRALLDSLRHGFQFTELS